MKMLLHFMNLSFAFIGLSGLQFQAFASKPFIIEERDEEGFFKKFREKPETFTASHLKIFLKRTSNIYPKEVTYIKKGQSFDAHIYKRLFKSGNYYFTLLSRHNLMDEDFFALENVKVAFVGSSSSGLQTKLHYNIFLGECEDSFSFRILYVSEFKKEIAETRLGQAYQKSKTTALVEEIVYKGVSGSWEETVKEQARREKDRTEKSQAKSEVAKKKLEEYYRHLEVPTPQPFSSETGHPLERKFSRLRMTSLVEMPSAGGPPKKVAFNTAPQAKEGIEQKYAKLPSEDVLPRKSSRSLLEEQKKQEKEFKEKREEEARVDSIGRRGSLGGSSGSTSPRFSLKRGESTPSPKSDSLVLASSSNTNQSVFLGERGKFEGSTVSRTDKEHYEVSQDDIDELFKDISASE